jgi:hypothetical protein
MKKQRYYYVDFKTGKTRWTAGKFIGWSKETGPFNVPYAGFERKSDVVWIPRYLLTIDARHLLPLATMPEEGQSC